MLSCDNFLSEICNLAMFLAPPRAPTEAIGDGLVS